MISLEAHGLYPSTWSVSTGEWSLSSIKAGPTKQRGRQLTGGNTSEKLLESSAVNILHKMFCFSSPLPISSLLSSPPSLFLSSPPIYSLKQPPRSLSLSLCRYLYSSERNRRRFQKVFPPKLFEQFIDIGHYVRDSGAYSPLLQSVNSMSVCSTF